MNNLKLKPFVADHVGIEKKIWRYIGDRETSRMTTYAKEVMYNHDVIVIKWSCDEIIIYSRNIDVTAELYIAPLAIIEGVGVYKDDIVYIDTTDGFLRAQKLTITGVVEERIIGNIISVVNDNGKGYHFNSCYLTTIQPKKKVSGWINVYPNSINNRERIVYLTKEDADGYASPTRTGCIQLFWEE